MKNPTASIGQLSLRVPGANEATGHRVATRVVESLGDRLAALPLGARVKVADLRVRVEPRDSSEEAISEAVVAGIERALLRHRRGI